MQETEGAALADAEEEAAWKAAAALEAAQAAVEKTAEIADGSDNETEENAEEAETAAVEAAEAEETAGTSAVETAGATLDSAEETADEAAEADAETVEESSEDIEEADEPEEEPVPLTPEEMAKNADEEAERALQEMMASFLNEFAVSGSEYRMTTEIIPDEEDVPGEAAPEKQSRVDREQMLGKETDESLGLTRTESFQEQLKKALEEGGNFEEASQIVISEEFESPEIAAKRAVMTAHGLEYDPDAEFEDEMEEEDVSASAEGPQEEPKGADEASEPETA